DLEKLLPSLQDLGFAPGIAAVLKMGIQSQRTLLGYSRPLHEERSVRYGRIEVRRNKGEIAKRMDQPFANEACLLLCIRGIGIKFERPMSGIPTLRHDVL